jgi:hypothetical protein
VVTIWFTVLSGQAGIKNKTSSFGYSQMVVADYRKKLLAVSVCVCLASVHAYADEPLAFKEPLDARVHTSQFTIYARIHPGFGIQFRKKQTLKSGVAGTVGFLLMGFPGIAAGPLAKRSKYTPTFLSVESAERLAPFYDAAAAQSNLERRDW